jgi:hypothetical protein
MSKIKEISLGKEFKIGLPNYSNLSLRCDIKFEVGENEEFDWGKAWDEVNWQLQRQSNDLQPDWMKDTKEYKNFFKITIRQPKQAEGEK